MATREENLKKINEALEKLDDEQLEQIAGGSCWTPNHYYLKSNTDTDSNQLDYFPLTRRVNC